MLFGNPEHFTKSHFIKTKGYAPEYLSELVVYCLELVSQLSYYKLLYRFKGGNSLLILLEDPQRFSIDVDIVTTVTKYSLTELIGKIVDNCEKFTKFEIRQHKTKPWLPMISYKLYFNSFFQQPEDSYIMLDAVLEEAPYPGIIKKVKCGKLYSSEIDVEVPSPSGLISDKLLTIGPSTLGIPLGKKKEAQRLKHIFDVALLLKKSEYNLKEIEQYILKCIEQENNLQRNEYTFEQVKEDTIKFCSEALEYKEIPDIKTITKPYLTEIIIGFTDFKKHLFKIDYKWQSFCNDCNQIIQLLNQLF